MLMPSHVFQCTKENLGRNIRIRTAIAYDMGSLYLNLEWHLNVRIEGGHNMAETYYTSAVNITVNSFMGQPTMEVAFLKIVP